MRNCWIALMGIALMLAGCEGTDTLSVETRSMTEAEQNGLLDFVNDQVVATFEMLDVTCELRSDTTRQILKHRDGQDKTPGTADDDLFDTLQELDDVAMVGPASLEALRLCAIAQGYLEPDPNTCVPAAFLPDGEFDDINYYWEESQLPPALEARVAELLVQAEEYAYPDRDLSIYPIRWAEVEIYSLNGDTVGYVVRFVQTIDPECGVQLHILYWLDTCYTELNSEAMI